ncbi:MAG: SGNH/GDSL hydrolase family protein [Acidimicrobiales bacterium]
MAVPHVEVTTRHRVARRALALSAVALLLPTACGLLGSGKSVVLFGDSLTLLVTPGVVKAAGSDFDVTSTATWGLRIDEELDPAAKVAGSDPDQVVVNLGTNNVLQRHDTTASIEDLKALVDTFTDVRCVHLVTINEQINRLGEDFHSEAAAINSAIREIAARRLDTDVIDWNQIVIDHAADNIMSEDTVHPNAAGVALLADAYLTAIRRC